MRRRLELVSSFLISAMVCVCGVCPPSAVDPCVAAQPSAQAKRGTQAVKKIITSFSLVEFYHQSPLPRPKKTRKMRDDAEWPISSHCRHFLAPLWSSTWSSGLARRGWSSGRPSGDATGRALLRPSQCPSHRQVATKTRDDASPLRVGCAARRARTRQAAGADEGESGQSAASYHASQ